ncbi:MAG TPA: hypothetical protein PKE06_20775 [Flavilitoribacter sp.]|nr:hypothetical protein [Flavilitoribacter sp.]HMQ88212.1 hypothetical protein [Flavilitoribacter sp.]
MLVNEVFSRMIRIGWKSIIRNYKLIKPAIPIKTAAGFRILSMSILLLMQLYVSLVPMSWLSGTRKISITADQADGNVHNFSTKALSYLQ